MTKLIDDMEVDGGEDNASRGVGDGEGAGEGCEGNVGVRDAEVAKDKTAQGKKQPTKTASKGEIEKVTKPKVTEQKKKPEVPSKIVNPKQLDDMQLPLIARDFPTTRASSRSSWRL